MRHLLTAAAFLIASPASAGPNCFWPPGSSVGNARWSTEGRVIETNLTTSNGNRYTCGQDIKQNNPSRQAGSKGYFKQACGPLTIVREVSYRNCTFEESAGISIRDGSLSKLICAISSNVISDTRYELRDKNSQTFQLGTEYGIDTGRSDSSDSCTSQIRTKIYTKKWNAGASEISLTTVTEYQAEGIKQPSL
jgi:hypothetical protein